MIKYRILWVLILLMLVTLACNLPSGAAPTRPPTPIPMTTQEVEQFEQEIAATLANPAPSGDVTVTITEKQINAYIAAQPASGTEEMIRDPQVRLTNGRVEVHGKVTQGPLTADARIVMVPVVAAGGKPKLDVESIHVGPLPVPDTYVKQVDQRVDTLLEDYLASTGEKFYVKTITVTEGQLTVSGTRQ